MFRFQTDCLFDIRFPTRQSLSRQSSNQVKTDIVESRCPQRSECLHRVRRRMGPSEAGQFAIIKSLCTETGPVDAQPSKLFKNLARDSTGIHLHCDLGAWLNLVMFVDHVQEAIELGR